MNKKGKMALAGSLVLMALLVIGLVIAGPNKPCRDGQDNDGDGYVDYPEDPGCSTKNDASELNLDIECDDGSDNDGDGNADSADSGCSSPTDDDETDCGDGVCEGGETQGSCPQDCGYPNSCTETDSGWDPFTQGTATGYDDNVPFEETDYCINSTQLNEFFCSGTTLYEDVIVCNATMTCTNGACS